MLICLGKKEMSGFFLHKYEKNRAKYSAVRNKALTQ